MSERLREGSTMPTGTYRVVDGVLYQVLPSAAASIAEAEGTNLGAAAECAAVCSWLRAQGHAELAERVEDGEHWAEPGFGDPPWPDGGAS